MSDGLTSNLRFTRVDAPIGALVEGFDPTEPIDERLVTPLANGLRDYSVLIFRDLTLDAGQLVALGRAFGELEILPEPDKRHPEHPEIFNLSNVGGDGQVVSFENPQSVFLRGTERWHTDCCSHARYPGPAARPSSPTCTAHGHRLTKTNRLRSPRFGWCTTTATHGPTTPARWNR